MGWCIVERLAENTSFWILALTDNTRKDREEIKENEAMTFVRAQKFSKEELEEKALLILSVQTRRQVGVRANRNKDKNKRTRSLWDTKKYFYTFYTLQPKFTPCPSFSRAVLAATDISEGEEPTLSWGSSPRDGHPQICPDPSGVDPCPLWGCEVLRVRHILAACSNFAAFTVVS